MPRGSVSQSALETSPISLGRIGRGSTLLIAVFGAWLYFTGWAFLYSYYDYFGVTLLEIDPSLQYVFMHSVPPLRYYLIARNIIYLLAGYIAIVASLRYILDIPSIYRHARSLLSPSGQAFLLFFIVILAFYISFSLGRNAGTDHAAYFWRHPPAVVYFNFKQSSSQNADQANLAKLNSDMQLKYLLSTKDFHFAFYRDEDCSDPHCGLIFKISADSVNNTTIIHP